VFTICFRLNDTFGFTQDTTIGQHTCLGQDSARQTCGLSTREVNCILGSDCWRASVHTAPHPARQRRKSGFSHLDLNHHEPYKGDSLVGRRRMLEDGYEPIHNARGNERGRVDSGVCTLYRGTYVVRMNSIHNVKLTWLIGFRQRALGTMHRADLRGTAPQAAGASDPRGLVSRLADSWRLCSGKP
jgi:hypothetical protein